MKDDLSELLEQDASTLGKVFENGLARVIVYNETLWLSFDEVGQQYCKDIWIAKYTPVPGVAIIALQLTPDSEEEIAAAMFGGAAPRKPYMAWQQRLTKPTDTLNIIYTLSVTALEVRENSPEQMRDLLKCRLDNAIRTFNAKRPLP